jgi:hypothetical protein
LRDTNDLGRGKQSSFSALTSGEYRQQFKKLPSQKGHEEAGQRCSEVRRGHGNDTSRAFDDPAFDGGVLTQANIRRAQETGIQSSSGVTDKVNIIGLQPAFTADLIDQPISAMAYGCGGLRAALNDLDIEPVLCKRLAQYRPHSLEIIESTKLRETEKPGNQINLPSHFKAPV